MGTVNKHGVLIDCKDLILCRKKDCKVILHIAEHEGLWRFGVDIAYGGTRTNAHGTGFLPSMKEKPYQTEKLCIIAAKAWASSHIRDHLSRFIGRKATVREFALQALRAVSGPCQEPMFKGRKWGLNS